MLEPLPETLQALAEMVSLEGPELDTVLYDLGRRATEIVPELVGLSLGVVAEGVTFTLVASDTRLAALDALQYLDGGPCVTAVAEQETIEATMDFLLDEGRWQLFARASSATGVASSLSLPLMTDGGWLRGGVNLYASTASAFTGKHHEIAAALGSSAADVVTNADLSFTSRLRAVEAPDKLREIRDVETAVGLLAARHGVDVEQARDRVRQAAARAGLAEALVARVVVLLHETA